MTATTPEEDAFHAALDAQLDDFIGREVFADWLQERGDPRAEGYRALGAMRKRAYRNGEHDLFYSQTPLPEPAPWYAFGVRADLYRDNPTLAACLLPDAWFVEVKSHPRNIMPNVKDWAYFKTRRQAEDLAALAYLKARHLLHKETQS